MKKRAYILVMLTGMLCPYCIAQSTYISYTKITGDADCGVSTNNTYTHKLDFGQGSPGATINGVSFDAYNAAADGTLNFNRTVSSGIENDNAGNGNHNVTGELANLLGIK